MVLNGQASEQRKVLAAVLQSSILGPLLCLIFIIDIPGNLECNVKIFAYDTSLYSLVHDPSESSAKLGRDLGKHAGWVHQQKMSFNPEPSKQAVEVHFPRKIKPVNTPPFILITSQWLDTKLINIQAYCQIKGWSLADI